MRSRAADLAGKECWTAEDVIGNEVQLVIDEIALALKARSSLGRTALIILAIMAEGFTYFDIQTRLSGAIPFLQTFTIGIYEEYRSDTS